MGGTSCDVALIKDGEPSVASRGKIEGRDIALPMIDINTVSAGGGTLARVDRFGVLEVGPQSAGAVPGPACYGRGGDAADHHRLQSRARLSQRRQFPRRPMPLDRGRGATRGRDASPSRSTLGVPRRAEGIVRIIDVKMQEAIKAISTMRGHDLRDFMLLAFGGAGPLHAGAHRARSRHGRRHRAALSRRLFGASGLLMSDVKHDYIRSRMTPIAALTADDVNARVRASSKTQARDDLRGDGFRRRRHPHRARARHALCRPGLRDHAALPGAR